MRKANEEGFTLVELIIVIVIIAILAAVAIPLYLNFRKGAIDSNAQADAVNAAQQIEIYYKDHPQEGLFGKNNSDGSYAQAEITESNEGSDSLPESLRDIRVSHGNTMYIGDSGQSGQYLVLVLNPNGNKSKTGIGYNAGNGGVYDY